MKKLDALHALSPADGRYAGLTSVLRAYFSEAGLMRYRVKAEVEYFIALCQEPLSGTPEADENRFSQLRERIQKLSNEDILSIKQREDITNHDVKAVEYFVKDLVREVGYGESDSEFVHFGLTSQDINNTAIPMMIRDAETEVMFPALEQLLSNIHEKAQNWQFIPMPAHTHGQPASPTKLGKEMHVFSERLEKQLSALKMLPYEGKFGGATGNFNAHAAAYPGFDWPEFANRFLEKNLGLKRQQYTTQIEHYDQLGARCDAWKRICVILTDLCRDIWQYISMEYFHQVPRDHEVGSSAMPHKVNPIDFENAEGNLQFAVALLEFFAHKLPISRLQRDLTDSTVLRNIGLPYAHIYISIQSIQKGFGKIRPNEAHMLKDLQRNWAVLTEAVQTILRREGYPNPYEALKSFSRTGEAISESSMLKFIEQLDVRPEVKAELKALRPENYTGLA